MRKNKSLTVLISLLAVLCIVFAGCSSQPKPENIEQYLEQNEELTAQLESIAGASGWDLSISGNAIVFTYDVNNMQGMTEEFALSDSFKSAVESAIDSQEGTYKEVTGSIRDQSGMQDFTLSIIYKYGDTEIVNKTYTAEDGLSEEEVQEIKDDAA